MEPLSANDPRLVGEFALRARLGSGGMGRVYLGFSPGGRAVAIKVVHPELARDPEFLRRFRQEVAAARAVSGMYTAPVVGSGVDDDPALAGDRLRARSAAGRRGQPGTARWPRPPSGGSRPAWPTRCGRCTAAAWCTGTSSPATCCSRPTGRT